MKAFIGNQTVSLKVQPKQVQKIVSLVGELQENCPELLLLLQAIAKVQQLDIPLKRNQAYVMKFMMHDYIKTASFFEEPESFRYREDIEQRYFTFLVVLVLIGLQPVCGISSICPCLVYHWISRQNS